MVWIKGLSGEILLRIHLVVIKKLIFEVIIVVYFERTGPELIEYWFKFNVIRLFKMVWTRGLSGEILLRIYLVVIKKLVFKVVIIKYNNIFWRN